METESWNWIGVAMLACEGWQCPSPREDRYCLAAAWPSQVVSELTVEIFGNVKA